MDSCEKISNSITAAKELIENETRSLAALHKAKQLEKELHKSGKLFRIPTMNGIIETTCPKKYIEYNNQFKIKLKMRTVTVEVPEGHIGKNRERRKYDNLQKLWGVKFEFKVRNIHPGDVIINPNRGGGSMMILSEIREERPLPFLPAIKVPFGLVAYVPSNDEGDRVFVKLTPEAGIGGMKGFRKATEEEKAKMLAAMKEEKHYSFNFEKLQPEYIPTVGDVVIVWDDNNKENAVVGIMNEVDETSNPYKINDGTWYKNCDKVRFRKTI